MKHRAGSLREAAEMARRWMFDAALPLWSGPGIDRVHGGFRDSVGLDGAPVGGGKRSFVQARQIYVFAAAGHLGWSGPWREAVAIGVDALERHCRHPAFGYVHSIAQDCGPGEARRDLYDQAFVAFGFAHAALALERPELVTAARALLVRIEREWWHPEGGYREGELPPQPPRRQNPHMHLFEANIALARSPMGEDDDVARMEALSNLFAARMVKQPGPFLPDFFGEDWQPLHAPEHAIVEPGHHFEWAWLLEEARKAGGPDYGTLARGLWRFAARHGIDAARGVAVDRLGYDGAVKSAAARLWPQSERLKAALALGENEAALEAFNGLQPYLQVPRSGAFHDSLASDGSFDQRPARASSLYHLVSAFAELAKAAA